MTKLTVFAAKQSTPMLFQSLDALEAKGEGATREERMAMTAIYEVLTERHDLDSALDDVFADEQFDGTYTEALRRAIQAQGT